MNRRVVITGVGPVTPIGTGRETFALAIQKGFTRFQRASQYDGTPLDGLVYGVIDEFSILEYLPARLRKTAKLMSRDVQLAVAASVLAMKDAGFSIDGTENRDRWGCISGAGILNAEHQDLAGAFQECIVEGNVSLKLWGQRSMQRLPPLMVLKYLPNMLGSHVSILHQLKGLSNTITCGEASGHMAIGEGYNAIRRGTCDLVLCGGAESRTNPTDLVYEYARRRLLVSDRMKHDQIRMPNHMSLKGIIPSEGAGYVVLEDWNHAIQRGARILAEVRGYAVRQSISEKRGLNWTASTSGLSRAIKAAMQAAKVADDDIHVVIPQAVGMAEDDERELSSLRHVFGVAGGPTFLNFRNLIGNSYAGNSLDVTLATLILDEQIAISGEPRREESTLDAGDSPLKGEFILSTASNTDGQNAALAIARFKNEYRKSIRH